jgi:2,3-bisphosphoglycerate-dependent phosphoglycerate mutase
MHAAGGRRALWLVRHAESVGNVADLRAREAGAARLDLDVRDPDVELSETGVRQAVALGRWLAVRPEDERPTVVFTSPYERAFATATHAVRESGLDLPIHRDERLRERDLGSFDGLTGVGIRDRFPDEAARRQQLGKFYYRPPGGESWADVALRTRSVLDMLERRDAGARVLAVSHQAVIMVFRYVLEEIPERELLELDRREEIANCAVTLYAARPDGRLELRRFNDVTHLSAHDEPVTKEPDAHTLAP